jgi:hypothetical protein
MGPFWSQNFLSYEKIGGKTTFFSHVFVNQCKRLFPPQNQIRSLFARYDNKQQVRFTTLSLTLRSNFSRVRRVLREELFIICARFSLFNALFRAPRKEEEMEID